MKRFLLFLIIVMSGALHAQQTFVNVTSQMGIGGQSGLGHAVGWGDIDGDLDPDLGMSNQEGDGFWFYQNNLTGFGNITSSAGLSGLGGNKIIIAELTGDEFNDLLLRTRSGTQYLFESNGDGTFNNITSQAGIGNEAIYNIADFDNDGLTDLLDIHGNNISVVYNNGNKTFSSPQVIAPLPDFMGIAVLDYNNDNLMDIYYTTYGDNPNTLLKNNGDGTFTDVTTQAGVSYLTGAHGVDVGDFNNDGFVDIYLGSYSSASCKLFQNNGDGTFSDVSVSSGTTGHNDTRTVTFVDYNNDGWLDIFSSHHDFYSYSNTMLKNNGDGTFTNTAVSLGLSGEWIGDYFGVGWADYDMDGSMDLFAAGHIDKYRLYKNNNCPGNWLEVDLKGIWSNPNGIGSRSEAWVNGQKISRFMLPDGGQHDGSQLRLHFGLDTISTVDSLVTYWPSGVVNRYYFVPVNQVITISEDEQTSLAVNPTYDLTIYPVPANHFLTVKIAGLPETKSKVDIFSSGGILMKTKLVNNENATIDVSTWPDGLYICKVSVSHKVFTKKFVVQHID